MPIVEDDDGYDDSYHKAARTAHEMLQGFVGESDTPATRYKIMKALNDLVWTSWNCKYAQEKNLWVPQLHVQTYTNTWTHWNDVYSRKNRAIEADAVRSVRERKDPSVEQRAAWKKQEDEARALEEKRKREEIEAKQKAEVLLLQHLSPQQQEDLRTKGCFFVEVGGEKYQINRGYAGNVKLLDAKSSKVRKSFCIHPRVRVPDADAMLAQKLLLEADKDQFHKVANITEYMADNDNAVPARPAVAAGAR